MDTATIIGTKKRKVVAQPAQTSEESMDIQKTTDYSIFKVMAGNRDINRANLRNLEISLSKKNLLHVNPIIVNENMEIIDGQHRLEAAKRLRLEVYYVVMNGVDLEEVQLLNANAKLWTGADYLESYVRLGYPAYKKLRDFMETHGIGLHNSMALLNRRAQTDGTMTQRFKTGKFKVVDMDWANDVADKMTMLRDYIEPNAFTDRDFMRAIVQVYEKNIIDWQVLLQNLIKYNRKISKAVTVRDYLRQLEDVYNYYKQTNITRLY